MAKPKTVREYRVAWEYSRDEVAILKDEIVRLRWCIEDALTAMDGYTSLPINVAREILRNALTDGDG